MSNYSIGSELVCVIPHILSGLKKGDIKRVQGIKSLTCKCGTYILYNVGMIGGTNHIGEMQYCDCGDPEDRVDGYWWYGEHHWAPLQTASEESDMEESIKEALEKPLFV